MTTATRNEVRLPMVFLGSQMKISKKTEGKQYMLAKFQNGIDVITFYIPSEDVMQEIGALQQFTRYNVILTLSAWNEKPQVDVIGIGGEAS